MGESHDDDDLQVDSDRVRGNSDEGCDGDRGREWNGGDGHASPGRTNSHQTGGWAYGHEASYGGCRYGNADSDAHTYHWYHSDCDTVHPSGHGYDRIHNGGPAGD